jgi:hypothetical protein
MKTANLWKLEIFSRINHVFYHPPEKIPTSNTLPSILKIFMDAPQIPKGKGNFILEKDAAGKVQTLQLMLLERSQIL